MGAVAAFVNGRAYEFLDDTLQGPAHRRVLPGQGRQRARVTADDVPTVLFDVSHSAKLLVKQLARGHDSGPQSTGRASGMQFAGEVPSRLSQQRINLTRRKVLGEHVNELGEQRNIRTRQQLLDLMCQLKQSRGSRCSRPPAHAADNAVTLHRGDLCSYPAGTEHEPGRDVVDRQWAALEKADNAPSAGIEQLLSEHLGTREGDLRRLSGRWHSAR